MSCNGAGSAGGRSLLVALTPCVHAAHAPCATQFVNKGVVPHLVAMLGMQPSAGATEEERQVLERVSGSGRRGSSWRVVPEGRGGNSSMLVVER